MDSSSEREKFEKWLKSIGTPTHKIVAKDVDGFYANIYVEANWTGWQARAALDSSGVREPVASTPDERAPEGWISVEEKLPIDQEWVLCYSCRGLGRAEVGNYHRGHWRTNHIIPTHWRPLPAAPLSKPEGE